MLVSPGELQSLDRLCVVARFVIVFFGECWFILVRQLLSAY